MAQYSHLPTHDDEDPMADTVPPEEAQAGFISKVWFAWVSKMIEVGYKNPLEIKDLLKLIEMDKSAALVQRWDDAWEAELRKSETFDKLIGKRCRDDDGNEGTLKWIGRLLYSQNPSSFYAGVEWDDVRRKETNTGSIGGDGWFYGEQIFECERGHGSFIKPHLLKIDGFESTPPPKTPFVAWGLKGAFLSELAIAGFFKLGNDICIFAGPLALQAIVKFLQKDDPQWSEGLTIVAILFICQIIQSASANQYFFLVGRVGLRMRQALSGAVFDKALIINERTRAHPDLNIGRIVNMMSTDSQRANDVVQSIHQIWSAPLQIIVSCVLLYRLVGVSLFAGIGVMLLMSPLQGKLMKKMMKVREQMVKFTDERVKAVSECLAGIRIVKFMAWTSRFEDRLNAIRNGEIDKLAHQQNLRVVMFFIIYLTPMFLTASTFIVYAVSGGEVDAKTVFPAIALFGILRFPFLVLPMQFNMMVNAKVSFDRLTQFLESGVVDEDKIKPMKAASEGYTFEIENGTFHAYEPQIIPELAQKKQQLNPDDMEDDTGAIQEITPQGSSSPSKPKPKKSLVIQKKYKLVPKPVLMDVNLKIRKSKLTMIVGATGSGKTCLLEALLGGVDVETGVVRRSGVHSGPQGEFIPDPVAYAPQQAWIMNSTLKENILFFSPEDERYSSVVDACQLGPDIAQLDDGDQTEIGEKGINLSGGQKQRVSIARAVYSKKQISMLDDPLSAVDPHVGKELMRRVIGSCKAMKPADWPEAELEGTTRVLVTHQIQFLKHADDCIYMKDGRVAAHFVGTDDNTVVNQILKYEGVGAKFFEPIRQAAELEEEEKSNGETPSVTPKNTKGLTITPKGSAKPGGGKLTSTEERALGSVSKHMYLSYVRASGGWYWFSFVMLLFGINQFMIQACDLWLTWWTDSVSSKDGSGSSASGSGKHDKAPPIGNDLGTYGHLLVYVGIIVGTAAANLCRGFATYSRFQAASRKFHELLVANVLRAPTAFFDTTPLGRLINRFSKDMDQVDVVLPPTVITFFQLNLQCLASVIIISTSQPLLLAMMAPFTFLYIGILKRFIRSNRETKRLDSISKSPIFQHFTETLSGMKTVHSYNVQKQFRNENRARMDLNTRTSYSNLACNRWLAIRVELMGNVICCTTALMAVVSAMGYLGSGASVGLMSLGITYSLSLTGQLNFLVRQVADLEAQMNGVERVVEFTENIDQEPLLIYDGDAPHKYPMRGKQLLSRNSDDMALVTGVNNRKSGDVQVYIPTEDSYRQLVVSESEFSRTAAPKLEANWPRNGRIVFENVKFRYRPGLPLVLKGLGGPEGLAIEARDKIGIVGRTGAGKSTLMLALFRFVEVAGGRITIDGRDIRTLKIDDLRGSLSMIPQDPVLFQGSVKSNLDPFEEHSDDVIWQRLRQVNLEERMLAHDNGIEGTVTEGGMNFSVGQRQLLCLARALLKSHSKILLMDEATASIDHATDMAIQITVREQFKDFTVLTVAHRLQTIMDSTKILVLDQGVCAEYDTPANLLADSGGILHEMAQKTGDFDRLNAIATGTLKIEDALAAKMIEKECAIVSLITVAAVAAAARAAR